MLKVLAFFIPGGKKILKHFHIPMSKKSESEYFYRIITSALEQVNYTSENEMVISLKQFTEYSLLSAEENRSEEE